MKNRTAPRDLNDVEELRRHPFQRSLIQYAIEQREQVAMAIASWPYACVYCGNSSDHRDHLLPLPWSGAAVRALVPTVPACADCNITLGTVVMPDIPSRAAYVAEHLRQKNRRILKQQPLDQEDVAEFTGWLKSKVQANEHRRSVLCHRLAVLDVGGLACYSGIPAAYGAMRDVHHAGTAEPAERRTAE